VQPLSNCLEAQGPSRCRHCCCHSHHHRCAHLSPPLADRPPPPPSALTCHPQIGPRLTRRFFHPHHQRRRRKRPRPRLLCSARRQCIRPPSRYKSHQTSSLLLLLLCSCGATTRVSPPSPRRLRLLGVGYCYGPGGTVAGRSTAAYRCSSTKPRPDCSARDTLMRVVESYTRQNQLSLRPRGGGG
jgi:hypothetical protein